MYLFYNIALPFAVMAGLGFNVFKKAAAVRQKRNSADGGGSGHQHYSGQDRYHPPRHSTVFRTAADRADLHLLPSDFSFLCL